MLQVIMVSQKKKKKCCQLLCNLLLVSKLLKTIAVCTCDTLKWSKTIYIYIYLVNNGRKLLFAWYNSITYDTSENDTLKAPISICTEQL